MSYLTLIIIAIAGIAVGYLLARRGRPRAESARQGSNSPNRKQTERKEENKRKILELVRDKKKIKNNDVERLLGVSDATATRYLEELEREGEILQRGETGKGVFYVLK